MVLYFVGDFLFCAPPLSEGVRVPVEYHDGISTAQGFIKDSSSSPSAAHDIHLPAILINSQNRSPFFLLSRAL